MPPLREAKSLHPPGVAYHFSPSPPPPRLLSGAACPVVDTIFTNCPRYHCHLSKITTNYKRETRRHSSDEHHTLEDVHKQHLRLSVRVNIPAMVLCAPLSTSVALSHLRPPQATFGYCWRVAYIVDHGHMCACCVLFLFFCGFLSCVVSS